MPGLNQLKKFSEDMLNVGDEVKIRAMRGEKTVTLPIPQNITVEDDSDEFVLGLPKDDEPVEEAATPTNLDKNSVDINLEDIDGNLDEVPDAPGAGDVPLLDDLFGGGAIDDDDLDLSDFEDTPVVEEEEPEEEKVSLDEMSLEDLLAGGGSDDFEAIPDFEDEIPEEPEATEEPVAEESSVAEVSTSGTRSFERALEAPEPEPEPIAEPEPEPVAEALEAPVAEEGAVVEVSTSGTRSFERALETPAQEPDSEPFTDFGTDLPAMDDLGEMPSMDEMPSLDEMPAMEEPAPTEDAFEMPEDAPATDDFATTDDSPATEDSATAEESTEDAFSMPDDFSMPSDIDFGDTSESGDLDEMLSEGSNEGGEFDAAPIDGLDMPDFGGDLDSMMAGDSDDLAAPSEETPTDEAAPADDFAPSDDAADDFALADDLPEHTDDLDAPTDDFAAPAEDFAPTEDAPVDEPAPTDDSAPEDVPTDDSEDAPTEEGALADAFADFGADLDSMMSDDTSGDAGADFGADLDSMMSDDASGGDAGDFGDTADFGDTGDSTESGAGETSTPVDATMEVPDFDAEFGGDSGSESVTLDASEMPQMDDSDFQMASPDEVDIDDEFKDFVIPGFSDTTTAKADKKGRGKLTGGAESDKPKNTFTEEEYEVFKKNFETYPLNLRIALEEFVVNDEFNEDVVFEILEKIYKKVPARQVASALEKWTGVPISVPRDYERRSVAQYEAYKQSFQYQLKNRIIPAILVAIVIGFLGYSVFILSSYFIYRPLKAASLYNQGYVLLQQNEFPQSEIKFSEAVKRRPVPKWFFKFADGFREKKQYDRAEKVYKSALFHFKGKKPIIKKAGLDWANMALYELANYPHAEEIVRRQVLDTYINDPDALLFLGDIFLEWAEVDREKFEEARAQYSYLINLYGSTDLYMGRMMRYFIRLDGPNSLRRVLELKGRFYPNKKSLSGDDWVELSGYLLEKLYGPLTPNEEPLRPQIEDLREMLERGTKFSPRNPVGHYNIAQYYENTENFPAAKAEFKRSLELFADAPVRNKKNTYREINANRHLGELYTNEREFLLAREIFTNGINLYQREAKLNGLEGTSDIGVLYADLGDIDYFIAGDMDGSLHNYTTSINTFNDNAYLRFKVGNIHYGKRDYASALGSFIKASETKPQDPNLLLALGNTLSLRGDNFASLAYYDELIEKLDFQRAKRDLLIPETNAHDAELLDMYIKGCNNIGVTQYKIAKQTGNSQLNAKALVNFSNSIRAYDALTRDKKTMLKVPGSNLAAQNSQYITHPISAFEPAIYTEIPRTLVGEKGLY